MGPAEGPVHRNAPSPPAQRSSAFPPAPGPSHPEIDRTSPGWHADEGEVPTPKGYPMATGHLLEMIARDEGNRPNARAVTYRALSKERGDGIDAVVITLADVPTYVRGPKAGQPNYSKCTNETTVYVTDEVRDRWLAEHPEVCAECANRREVFVRWSADEGTTMKPCPECNADGSRPVEDPDEASASVAEEGTLFCEADA